MLPFLNKLRLLSGEAKRARQSLPVGDHAGATYVHVQERENTVDGVNFGGDSGDHKVGAVENFFVVGDLEVLTGNEVGFEKQGIQAF